MAPAQPPNPQPELALDHSPALEARMRELFETRWSRWHPKTYEEAVADPFTRHLLCLAVQHMPPGPVPRRTRRHRR